MVNNSFEKPENPRIVQCVLHITKTIKKVWWVFKYDYLIDN